MGSWQNKEGYGEWLPLRDLEISSAHQAVQSFKEQTATVLLNTHLTLRRRFWKRLLRTSAVKTIFFFIIQSLLKKICILAILCSICNVSSLTRD